MAAMMVSAGPAQANETDDFDNSNNFVLFGNSLFGVGDIGDDDGIDFDDIFGFGRHHHGIDFDGIDFDSNDGILGFGSGIDQDADSGRVSIGSDVS